MKNIYIIIIVLVVLVAGAMFFLGMGKQAEAPTLDKGIEESGVISNEMPAKDAPSTEETSVMETPTQPGASQNSQNSGTATVKEFVVLGQNFSFTPSMITVKKGDRVKITFKNTFGFHDFKIDEYGVAAKQAQSPTTEVLEFTADKVGSFEYYCSVGTHRAMGMKGVLKVE